MNIFGAVALAICMPLAFAGCGPAGAESGTPQSGGQSIEPRADRLPAKLGAALPGFNDIRRDTAGTPVTRLPEDLAEAAFVAFDGRYLRFYDDGEDDGHESYDPTPEGDEVFWRGRFRPIFAKLLKLPGRPGLTPVVSLRFAGVVATDDEGDSYRSIFPGLPPRSTEASAARIPVFRDVMDLWQNPRRTNEIVALNKHEILFSSDGGDSFQKFRLPGNDLSKATLNVLTGRVGEAGDIREIFVGTYLRGIARCVPTLGWRRLNCRQLSSAGLPFLIHEKGSYFREEISGIAFAREEGLLITTSRFQAAINLYDTSAGRTKHLSFPLPGFTGGDHAESLFYDAPSKTALIGTNRGIYAFHIERRKFRHIPLRAIFGGEAAPDRESRLDSFAGLWFGEGRLNISNFLGPDSSGRAAAGHEQFGRTPSNMRAMYISPTSARRKMRTVLDLLDNYNHNAAVIDVKDDFGRLIYGSKLPEAKAMNNHRQRADIRGLVKKLKARGVYTIARQVVFKDKVLFKYQQSKYAIRTRGGGPWIGSGEERWVDTYSDWVHDYNVRISEELVELGFDEIQFDYIRFPSDGPIGRCVWKYRKGDAYKSEALENFLMKARRRLTKPISVDIYGYHGIYRAGTVIGQDMIDVGEFVDVVSPMHYSSHFGNRYLDHYPKNVRAYELLKLGTERPMRMGQGRFQVRPWIQAFKMKISIWGWGENYMRNQILGSVDGGASGFLWWGPIKEFYLPGRVQNQLVKPNP
ncbi:MAG: putative glycoside hydrolase [bacterium]|nr:putative glycoside hydrolase [bacterium]